MDHITDHIINRGWDPSIQVNFISIKYVIRKCGLNNFSANVRDKCKFIYRQTFLGFEFGCRPSSGGACAHSHLYSKAKDVKFD